MYSGPRSAQDVFRRRRDFQPRSAQDVFRRWRNFQPRSAQDIFRCRRNFQLRSAQDVFRRRRNFQPRSAQNIFRRRRPNLVAGQKRGGDLRKPGRDQAGEIRRSFSDRRDAAFRTGKSHLRRSGMRRRSYYFSALQIKLHFWHLFLSRAY
ncbi:thioredoxin domain-containing protein 2-like [Podarcis raffonei]|uniref:thioredoxin domain-containing protein 2-like n=1 Tax=Podarcis raffonei TaxID=65483 RepID=UPI0023290942|nr:thioredoxin domain-containing protein 2-like [Podarcis raffonei]